MEILKTVETRWRKLDNILTGVVNALNLRTPRKGNGILLTESPSGVIIAIEPSVLQTQQKLPNNSSSGSGGGVPDPPTGGTAGWHSMQVMDPATCTPQTIYYWGTPPA